MTTPHEKTTKATWRASIFCDCPHCGEQQDLVDSSDEPRMPVNLIVGEHGTERTQNFETYCMDCDEMFIVEDLEW